MSSTSHPYVFWIVLGTTKPEELVDLPGSHVAAFKDFESSQLADVIQFMADVRQAIGQRNSDRKDNRDLPYAHEPQTFVIGDLHKIGVVTVHQLDSNRIYYRNQEQWEQVLSTLSEDPGTSQ